LADILKVSKLNCDRLENLPSPLFGKEGINPLWQREGRRDFMISGVIILRPLIKTELVDTFLKSCWKNTF
jgi:hypothetical protein